MKGGTESLDLVIIIALLLVGTSFYISLTYKLQGSSMNYMDDKTLTYQYSVEYDYSELDTNGIPQNIGLINVDADCILTLPLVQDNYCPFTGHMIAYNDYDTAKHSSGDSLSGLNTNTYPRVKFPVSGEVDWKTYKLINFQENNWNTLHSKYNGLRYMVYNSDNNSWIATSDWVNVFNE